MMILSGKRSAGLELTRSWAIRALISALALTGGAATLTPSASAAGRVTKVWVRDFDLDGRRERLERVAATKTNPFGGTARIHVRYLRLIDHSGGRTISVRVSPKLEHLEPHGTGVLDTNRDGTPDIWYSGFIGGAGGALPHYFGMYNWTGARKRLLWSYSPRTSGLGRHYGGASFGTPNLDDAYEGDEIVLKEGVLSSGDANCCPSRLRISTYGWDAEQKKYILIGRRYEDQ